MGSIIPHDEKIIPQEVITTRKNNDSEHNEGSKAFDIAEIDNLEILKNKQKIKAIEKEITPLLKQSQDIIKLKDEIGCVKMLNKLNEFNKNNKHLFAKELEIAKLRYSNEKIVLSALQAKFNNGLINDSDLKKPQIKTLEMKLQMLRSEITNTMKEYDFTGDTKFLDKKHRIESEESATILELQKLIDGNKSVKINKHNDYLHGKS